VYNIYSFKILILLSVLIISFETVSIDFSIRNIMTPDKMIDYEVLRALPCEHLFLYTHLY